MTKKLKIKITGFVQGIGFRYFVKDNADKLNIKGYNRVCLTTYLIAAKGQFWL
jgi:acylphosphatase